MTNKTLSVSAIQNGTVIDHIKQGNALRIIRFLGLLRTGHQITIGMNLPSKRLGLKDLIKIESTELSSDQANQIMVFAPEVTINIVKDFDVTQKLKTSLPERVTNIFNCPNMMCISQDKNVDSIFYIEEQGKRVGLTCHYCERTFDRDHIKVKL
jgi:aspartate carbamoyltransferase regulatory subunit